MVGLHLVVVSGLSGSGKSHVLKSLEDLGYFCVDNLPPALLLTFVELCHQQEGEIKKIALGIDIREGVFFSDLVSILERIKAIGHSVDLVFFEARTEVLVRRFSESRRPHPLVPHLPIIDALQMERKQLSVLRGHADSIIDTSDLNVHELRELLVRRFGQASLTPQLTISLVTFGFKFGVPYDIDFLFDVRFLRNPFFVTDLKSLTGEDPRVMDYVLIDPDALDFLAQLKSFFDFLIPRFERERRRYVKIAIGCTGGRHRSVVIAGQLQNVFTTFGYHVSAVHRDLLK